MEHITTALREAGKDVVLSHEEREDVWKRIRRSVHTRHDVVDRRKLPWERFIGSVYHLLYSQTFALGAFVIVAFASLSFSVTTAVSAALPGDSFYPMKIGLEDVASSMRWSEKSRGVWEAERAVRRLEEAEILATNDKLDAGKREFIRTTFGRHWQEAQKLASGLSTGGDAPSASAIVDELDSTMRAHVMVLSAVNDAMEEAPYHSGSTLQPLLEDVQEASESVYRSRREVTDAVRLANGTGMRTAAQERIHTATRSLEETRWLLRTGSGRYATGIVSAVEARGQFAVRMLTQTGCDGVMVGRA
ncbi:MAG: DUF5667 domain-containing protein, partial [Patescibacteria group bacterium]